ncbi:uncharacterized protein LOC119161103 isoform X3 [Rhipicephalus microplus]|uniref:uncharacterized protein LOC119161103 isoform X3 n=1 Tax=Rhipicephalus microplus TaxID=6941 RepID=UPI003F6CA486
MNRAASVCDSTMTRLRMGLVMPRRPRAGTSSWHSHREASSARTSFSLSRARQPRARQQEDSMDAHVEVVGVGPRDFVNRLGDFVCEPCIYFFWALLCLLAKAGNAKHLLLEAPCVLTLSGTLPTRSREGSCDPTTPVRRSSPQQLRPRSSIVSTPETPKRSPLVNI